MTTRVKGFRREIARVNNANTATPSVVSQEDALNALNAVNSTKMSQPVATPVAEPPETNSEESGKPADSNAAPTVSLTPEQIQVLVNAAVEQAVINSQTASEQQFSELKAQLEASQNAAETARKEAEKAKQEKQALANVFSAVGLTTPVNKTEAETKERSGPAYNRIPTNSDEPFGAAKEAIDILNSARYTQKTTQAGNVYGYRDQAELDRFVKNNRSAVLLDLESWAKRNGLLGGRGVEAPAVNAATTIGNIPGGFLDVLSAVMRTENRVRYIFWQFANTVHQFNAGLGVQAQIPRSALPATAQSVDDRLLSGGGVYRRIDDGNQNLSTGIEFVTLNEYGLGANPNARPIMLPTFVQAYAMIELVQILNRNLLWDYYGFEELLILSQYRKTTAILYNNAGAVTSTPAIGVPTPAFYNNLFAYMQEQQVPTLADGCYVATLPSLATAAFKNSFQGTSQLWQAPSVPELQALTNIMNPTVIGSGETDRVNGYIGKYNNFHLFDTNSFGVGAPTTNRSNGVGTQTISSQSVTTRSSFAFGADAVGRAIGTEFQIVQDEKTDFGRSNRYIWRSEEASVALDVCPQPGDPRPIDQQQQLRVFETRFVV